MQTLRKSSLEFAERLERGLPLGLSDAIEMGQVQPTQILGKYYLEYKGRVVAITKRQFEKLRWDWQDIEVGYWILFKLGQFTFIYQVVHICERYMIFDASQSKYEVMISFNTNSYSVRNSRTREFLEFHTIMPHQVQVYKNFKDIPI